MQAQKIPLNVKEWACVWELAKRNYKSILDQAFKALGDEYRIKTLGVQFYNCKIFKLKESGKSQHNT